MVMVGLQCSWYGDGKLTNKLAWGWQAYQGAGMVMVSLPRSWYGDGKQVADGHGQQDQVGWTSHRWPEVAPVPFSQASSFGVT